jgi:E-phenylitaconyl-CoA hydratase
MLATDIRVACESANFGLSEPKRGAVAGNGGTQRIIQQLPYAIAMEILLTAEPFTAQQAKAWGLVNQVVPEPRDVLPAAMAYARKISKIAPLAAQASKELALRARDMPLGVGLRMEQLVNRILGATDDSREGGQAFSEKRPPVFKGA